MEDQTVKGKKTIINGLENLNELLIRSEILSERSIVLVQAMRGNNDNCDKKAKPDDLNISSSNIDIVSTLIELTKKLSTNIETAFSSLNEIKEIVGIDGMNLDY